MATLSSKTGLPSFAAGQPDELNLVNNPSAAIDTTGYAATGTATVTRLASGGPLDPKTPTAVRCGAGSAADYVSYALTIPAALTNRKLKLEWYQTAPTAGEWRVEVHGASEYTLSTDSGGDSVLPAATGKYTTTFDTTAETALEVRFVRVAGSGNLDLAGLVVGPGIQPQGAVVGEWIDGGAISITASTNPTLGTTARNRVFWRRVGDSMELRYEFEQTSAGTAGSGLYRLGIPSGYTIDSSKVAKLGSTARSTVGTGQIDSTALPYATLSLDVGNGDYLIGHYSDQTNNQDFSAAAIANFSEASLTFSFTALVPIAEWAGSGTTNLGQNDVEYASNFSTSVSNDAVSFAYGPSGSSMPNGAASNLFTKTVRFTTPVQETDELVLEVFDPTIGGRWTAVGQTGTSTGGSLTWEYQNPETYGMLIRQNLSVPTDINIQFGKYYQALGNTFAAAGGNWSDISTRRWRVRKTSGGQAVGFGHASATSSGLVSREDSGSFTALFKLGMNTSDTNITVNYHRVGDVVTLQLPSTTVTANATASSWDSISGSIPADLRPTQNVRLSGWTINNGSTDFGAAFVTVKSDGKLEVTRVVSGSPANWNSGTASCGFQGFSLTYIRGV